MNGELHTDEYTVSISREIAVCRNMIAAAARDLARLEEQQGATTAEVLAGKGLPDGPQRRAWLEAHAGLVAWRQRLREYQEAYAAMRG